MDIKLTHSLLTQYLKTDASPEQIAERLSLSGPTVDRLEKVPNDWVYHLEIITNRVDAASAFGVAREAAAILPEFGFKAELVPYNSAAIQKRLKSSQAPPLDITVHNNPRLNQRIVAIKISDVTIKPSPRWLQTTLDYLGQRSLNNVIDITNYVMFELGHPVHVFDYDRLTEKKIIVREAQPGEKLTTLDGKTHTLRGGEIVYDDGTGTIIDLPGIMGTANSVVTDSTKNVLLWIEDNNGKKIRSASLIHQIRTHAAILNEKQVDPELALPAMLRAAELTLELSHGRLGSQLLDMYPAPIKPKTVQLSIRWLAAFAGVSIPKDQIIRILQRLGFGVTEKSADLLVCRVPSWRAHDIAIKEDLAEEITRIYGYFKLPSILPVTGVPKIDADPALALEQTTRSFMAELGFTEIYNYSLVSKNLLNQAGYPDHDLFKLQNPLSEEYEYMRPSLIPSLLQNLDYNRGLVSPPINMFELSNVYRKEPKLPLADEIPMLAFTSIGKDFRSFKGDVGALLHHLHTAWQLNQMRESHPPFDPKRAGIIKLDNGQVAGYFGVIRPEIAQSFHLAKDVLMGEFNFRILSGQASLTHQFTPVPLYPPIIEDLTFTLRPNTAVGIVLDTIKSIDSLIEAVELKTIYNQNYTFTITYRSPTANLTSDDIAPIRNQIVSLLDSQHHADLVGKLT